jgi:alginate O-acetyltransferase complex protein AlgI
MMAAPLRLAHGRPRLQSAARLGAWSTGPVAIAAAHFAMADSAPVLRMAGFIGVLFAWMKCVVLAEFRAAGGKPLPPVRLLAWLLLWPGMRPQRMLRDAVGGWLAPFVRGLACAGVGLALVFGARVLWLESGNRWLATPPLLVGLSLMLHFGLLNLLAAAWRAAGVDVRPLFRSPLASASLRDFWMRRWNIAFSEMCQESVVRVTRPLGSRAATAAVFLFSALAHEAAISLPVRAGYGLPSLYFAIHGAGVLVEPRLFREGSIGARLWTALLVVAPLPLVFHEPFLAGIVWPIIGVTPWTT